MTTYDLTRPIRPGMPIYPGDPEVEFEAVAGPRGDRGAEVTRVRFGSHTGTHVDAPAHVRAGGLAVEALPLAAMLGTARVVTVGGAPVAARELREIPSNPPRLLLRGPPPDGATLTESAARALVERGTLLVGVEGLSIEDDRTGALPVHRALLTSGIVLVEGLRLDHVPDGVYELACLPVPLVGLGGAPARVILRTTAP